MFQHVENASALTMSKKDWLSAVSVPDEYVELDVSGTPMSAVEKEATLLAAVATRHSSGTGQVEIYRDDPRDAPNNVNADLFTVWENIQQHPKFEQIVSDASTEINQNLLQYLDENVLLVPQRKSASHWSTSLPPHVIAVMGPRPESSSSSTIGSSFFA